ncbi:MAG: hypothetical protein NT013_30225 [Planctomycetia bacterium]|nr:hypothetical protein [Planctomycetia bacterium]
MTTFIKNEHANECWGRVHSQSTVAEVVRLLEHLKWVLKCHRVIRILTNSATESLNGVTGWWWYCNGFDANRCHDHYSSRPLVERSDTTAVHWGFTCFWGRFGGRSSEQVVAPVVSLSGMKVLTPFAALNARVSVVGVLPNFQGFGGH